MAKFFPLPGDFGTFTLENVRPPGALANQLSKKTPQSARSGCQLPFQGSQGGFAARVARLATHRVHCNFQQKSTPESKKRIYFFRKI